MRKKCKINSKTISYLEAGSGQPIVFLHGWGRSGDDFMSLIESLDNNYRMISVDLPGHGESEEPSGDLSLNGYVETIKLLLEELNVENPILVCHSFGARIAIKMAARGMITNQMVFTGGAGIEQKSLGFKLKVAHYKFMKLLVKTPLYHQYRDDLFANSGSADYKNASATMKKVLSLAVNEDLTKLLPKINNQVLLFWGENDEATPLWQGQLMNQAISNSTLISKQNLTHYAFLEDSSEFNTAVKQFIGGEHNGK